MKSVLVVGAGGLGSTALLALAEGGARRLGVADGDRVELSNLHRQILHAPCDLGEAKTAVAARRLSRIAPEASVETYPAVDTGNVSSLFDRYDFVIDATDDPVAKFLLNDAAVLSGKPLCHAGVVGFTGQCFTILPRESACLRCLFPEPPLAGEVASCQQAGILGPLAGMIGALQANEALAFVAGRRPRLADRLFTVDGRTLGVRTVSLRRSPDCPVCGAHPTIRRIEAESLVEETQ